MKIGDIWQLCYAHDDGWKVVYDTISDDGVRRRCINLLRNIEFDKSKRTELDEYIHNNPNVDILNDSMFHEYGVTCDERAVYVYRTQYGLKEKGISASTSGNRDVYFSHAFVFPWEKYDCLYNPEIFLSVSNEYFKSSVDSLKIIQNNDYCIKDFNINSSLEKLGISVDTYYELIKHIFVHIFKSYKYDENDDSIIEPIYVRFNKSLEDMMHLLYCVFMSVPVFFRKCLSAATGEISKSIIHFVADLRNDYHLIDLESNNFPVFSSADIELLNNNMYICKALDEAFLSNSINNSITNFYRYFDQYVIDLYGGYQINKYQLGLAYKVLYLQQLKKNDDFDVLGELYDALNSNANNSILDNYISQLMNYVSDNRITISDALEKMLKQYIDKSSSFEIRETYNHYLYIQFISSSSENKTKVLSDMSVNDFKRFLKGFNNGYNYDEIMDLYFSIKCLDSGTLNLIINRMKEFLDCVLFIFNISESDSDTIVSNYLSDFNKDELLNSLIKLVDDNAKKLLMDKLLCVVDHFPNMSRTLLDGLDEAFRSSVKHGDAFFSFKECCKLLCFFYKCDQKEYVDRLINWKACFWNDFNVSNLSIYDDYSLMINNTDNCVRYTRLVDLVKGYNGDSENIYSLIYSYFLEYYDFYDNNSSEKKVVVSWLQRNIIPFNDYTNSIKKEWVECAAYIIKDRCFKSFMRTIEVVIKFEDEVKISNNIENDLIDCLFEFYNTILSIEAEDKLLLNNISSSILPVMREKERMGIVLPLDLWFIVGLLDSPNSPFSLLEKEMPACLNKYSKEELKNSIILNKTFFFQLLIKYSEEKRPLSREAKNIIYSYKKYLNKSEKKHEKKKQGGLVLNKSSSDNVSHPADQDIVTNSSNNYSVVNDNNTSTQNVVSNENNMKKRIFGVKISQKKINEQDHKGLQKIKNGIFGKKKGRD